MVIEIIVIILLVLILLTIMISSKRKKPEKQSPWDSIREADIPHYRLCPLCKSPLVRGENVHSHLYPGKPDGMMHIFGCPHCYKTQGKDSARRYCPYCSEPLSAEDYVIARVFQKPGKTQVHVLGCTRCRLNR